MSPTLFHLSYVAWHGDLSARGEVTAPPPGSGERSGTVSQLIAVVTSCSQRLLTTVDDGVEVRCIEL